jgi:hypothetical protein
MNSEVRQVGTAAELAAAANDTAVRDILVTTNLTALSTVHLSPGKTLRGVSPQVILGFAVGQDGIQLSTDNTVEGLEIRADVERRALFNDTQVEHLGRLVLRDLRTTGVEAHRCMEENEAGGKIVVMT